jgi:crotonobetaine/carnitine-CoA ligase
VSAQAQSTPAIVPHAPRTLGGLLSNRAAETSAADKVFLRTLEQEVTYREFDELTSRVAGGLAAQGVAAGQCVPVLLPNRLEFLLSWFGLAKLGAVMVPIDVQARGTFLETALGVGDPAVVIADRALRDSLAQLQGSGKIGRVIVCRGDDDSDVDGGFVPFDDLLRAEPVAQRQVQVGDPAAVYLTSGSTGHPKGVVVSHASVIRRAEIWVEEFAIRSSDVMFTPFPLHHTDASIGMVAVGLVVRATVAIQPRFSASGYWNDVRRFEATVTHTLGPDQVILFNQPPHDDDADNPLRLMIGAGPIRPSPFSADFERRFGVTLGLCYGQGECWMPITYALGEPERNGSCGRPHGSFEVRIFDDDDREVRAGTTGEIVLRPTEPYVFMDGYFRDPAATVAATRNLWYHTGDLAYQDDDGYVYYIGRKHDVIRRRGENISALQVEEIVAAHPAVREVAAIAVPSEVGEDDLKICVIVAEGSDLTPAELAQFCAERMARFMVPRYIEFYAELPRTATQKVAKTVLKQAGVTPATWDRERTGRL